MWVRMKLGITWVLRCDYICNNEYLEEQLSVCV